MYFIYSFLLLVLVLLLFPVILFALILVPKFRAGFFQKLGFYKNISKSNGKKNIVVHAVSVGEVLAVEKFVKLLAAQYPNDNIILTTVTKTGNAVADQKLADTVAEIIYFPFDLFFSVKSFIKKVKPDMVIIAETEIWPYFSHAIKKKNIPILIVNGRISPNSYKGYKKFNWFFSRVLANYSKILMQTKGDMERIIKVGAPDSIAEVMGNVKVDISRNLSEEEILNWKNDLKIYDSPVFIAGSTHKGEDEIAISAYKKLLDKNSNLKMILAPRHPERLKDVEGLLVASKLSYGKRSTKDDFSNNQVILVDTMGELAKLYAISTVAYVGGSFSNTGGHNPLEASIYDIPVVSGPATFNFKDIYKFLVEYGAAKVVPDAVEFYNELEKLFFDREYYEKSSQACSKVFMENSGAIQYALNVIKGML